MAVLMTLKDQNVPRFLKAMAVDAQMLVRLYERSVTFKLQAWARIIPALRGVRFCDDPPGGGKVSDMQPCQLLYAAFKLTEEDKPSPRQHVEAQQEQKQKPKQKLEQEETSDASSNEAAPDASDNDPGSPVLSAAAAAAVPPSTQRQAPNTVEKIAKKPASKSSGLTASAHK